MINRKCNVRHFEIGFTFEFIRSFVSLWVSRPFLYSWYLNSVYFTVRQSGTSRSSWSERYHRLLFDLSFSKLHACETQPAASPRGNPMEERKERSEGRTLRVDRIGAPNLGIRICRLICGFHRNCLSTRCLHAPGSDIHLFYVSSNETRACGAASRVRPSPDFVYCRWLCVHLFHWSLASFGGAFSRGRS